GGVGGSPQHLLRGRQRGEVGSGLHPPARHLRTGQGCEQQAEHDNHRDEGQHEHGPRSTLPVVAVGVPHGSTCATAAALPCRPATPSHPPATGAPTVTVTHGGSRSTLTAAPGPATCWATSATASSGWPSAASRAPARAAS